jgi:hypothetical protein
MYHETPGEYLARLEALRDAVDSALVHAETDDEREHLGLTWDHLSDEIGELSREIEDAESYGAMRNRVRGGLP